MTKTHVSIEPYRGVPGGRVEFSATVSYEELFDPPVRPGTESSLEVFRSISSGCFTGPFLGGVPCGLMAKTLTARQQEVLDLWLSGKTYKEVAAQLGISPETVNPHLKNIAAKLGATGISREALRDARSA